MEHYLFLFHCSVYNELQGLRTLISLFCVMHVAWIQFGFYIQPIDYVRYLVKLKYNKTIHEPGKLISES